jgi:hypothetical protein
MSDIDDDNFDAGPGDDALRARLRALRIDRAPEHDLWPAISASIAQDRRSQARAGRQGRVRRVVPWAIAASCVLALALAWQWPASRQADPQARLIAHEAQAMTREYQGALKVIASSAPDSVDADPALRELDRSAAQIRSALQQDPDARFLLDRLRRTYAMRLELTQRAAFT